MTHSPPVGRRWFQLRLRTLLILFLLIGLSLGWVGAGVRRMQTQSVAAAALQERGGTAMQCGGPGPGTTRIVEQPIWVRVLAGEENCRTINYVHLHEDAGDDDLRHLAGLPYLQVLMLNSPHFTDAGLARLRDIPELESLSLSESSVTDRGLASILVHKQLEFLDLSQTRITDAGLSQLTALPRLRYLQLSDTGITDAGLATLQHYPALQEVEVENSAVTEAGVAALRRVRPELKVKRE